MYHNDIQKIAQTTVKKIKALQDSTFSYLIQSALAGAYVAFGIGLILCPGAPLAASGSPVTKLVVGATFGIALTLVIFAGSELFTGNNMFGVVAALTGHATWDKVLSLWLWCYLGNLIGS